MYPVVLVFGKIFKILSRIWKTCLKHPRHPENTSRWPVDTPQQKTKKTKIFDFSMFSLWFSSFGCGGDLVTRNPALYFFLPILPPIRNCVLNSVLHRRLLYIKLHLAKLSEMDYKVSSRRTRSILMPRRCLDLTQNWLQRLAGTQNHSGSSRCDPKTYFWQFC